MDRAALVRRMRRAALVGPSLLPLWLLAVLGLRFVPPDVVLPVSGLVAAVLTWPLLVLLRLRPAWPVALLGPVVTIALFAGGAAVGYSSIAAAGLPLLIVAVLAVVALGYALAALVTARDVRPRLRLLTAAVTVLLYLGVAGLTWSVSAVRLAGQHRNDDAVAATLAAGRRDAEERAERMLADRVEALRAAGIIKDRVGSSKLDVCYLDHEDAGWTVSSWYQNCGLRYVEGFTTGSDRGAAEERILALGAPEDFLLGRSPQFGKAASKLGSLAPPCVLFTDDERGETLRYRPSGSGGCEVPDPTGFGAIHSDHVSTKEYRTFDPSRLGNDQDQIWLVIDEHYSHEVLGCGVSGIIFCESPRDKPVQAP